MSVGACLHAISILLWERARSRLNFHKTHRVQARSHTLAPGSKCYSTPSGSSVLYTTCLSVMLDWMLATLLMRVSLSARKR